MSLCAIPVFCMAVVETPVGFIIERLFIGCSLAAFVICQFWSSIMFSPTVVGLANAVAGGWGNAGEPAPNPPSPEQTFFSSPPFAGAANKVSPAAETRRALVSASSAIQCLCPNLILRCREV